MRAILGLAWAMAALACGQVRADSWLPPTTQTYASEDGQWRLTVVPRGITSPLPYFEDQVAGRSKPGGAPSGPTQSMGRMEHQVQGRWQTVWQAALVNETAPVDAIVSAQGVAVTFDNWHSAGFGSDVVVLYDGAGRKVRALSLEDFLPAAYVRALPASVSSIWWGGGHAFSVDGRQLILRVVVPQKRRPSNGAERPDQVEIRLDVATGRVMPPAGPEWERALVAAREVNAELDAERALRLERLKSPLAAPTTGDRHAWHEYLYEAHLRIAPGTDLGTPAVGFLAAGVPADDERDQKAVSEALRDAVEEPGGCVVLGSPDPARLVRVVARLVAALRPGALRDSQVYMAVPLAWREAAAEAIAPSGASSVVIDTSRPVPQSPQRMKRFEAEHPHD